MGNSVSNEQVRPGEFLNMSNGLTAVFIDTLCLAGATIATEDYQKDLMVWLGQRDWTMFGLGCISFDLAEIIWEPAIFDQQKAFLIQVAELAINKSHWHLLDYSPHEEWALQSLARFRTMLTEFEVKHIHPEQKLPLLSEPGNYPRCPEHGVYLTVGGCVVCNNR
ncbi:MAG: hypothetical protein RLZZ519_1954 [Bacteroidota bacterium]|jgi:hypothetical protein